MARFSKKVTHLLLDELTGWTVREIDGLFEGNEIALGEAEPNPDVSVRRHQVRAYLASLRLETSATDRVKLTGVLTDVLQQIARRTEEDPLVPRLAQQRWEQTLAAEGFSIDPETHAVTAPGEGQGTASHDSLSAVTDHVAIHDHLVRLSRTVDTDPRLAVSTAKALIESTAKIVLTERGQPYSRAEKIPALVSQAQAALGLSPRGVSDEEPALRKVLQSLVALTQGVTEIRNQVGVDHGTEEVPGWIRPRHARLVVGAAQVWCQLMLETLNDQTAPWRSMKPTDST